MKNFFDALIENYTFLLKGVKEFKEVFLPGCEKFDHQLHEIVSFDAKSLYTSVDIETVVDHVLTEVYRQPQNFFDEQRDKKGNLLNRGPLN